MTVQHAAWVATRDPSCSVVGHTSELTGSRTDALHAFVSQFVNSSLWIPLTV